MFLLHETNLRLLLSITIVSRGDWLGKPANIKVENNGAEGYVGSLYLLLFTNQDDYIVVTRS